jgi:flagellar hook-associated protein 1 FlgK
VTTAREEVGGQVEVRIVVEEDGDPLPVTGGKIGGLLSSRDGTIDVVAGQLDDLAAQLIFEINKLHSTGVNKDGFTRLEAALQIPIADRTIALNDPNNQTLADLPFAAVNGGFYVNVRNESTGSSEQVFIEVDLDGLTNTGAAGFDDDTSADDLRVALDGIDGLNASWGADGSLVIESQPGFTFSFQDDTSGALAVLGVNTYFTGTDASSIAVRQSLIDDPESLALGRFVDGQFVENGAAKEVAGLQTRTLDSLGRRSITGYWLDAVQGVATTSNAARTEAQAAQLVRESLEQQRSAVSGVSLDEESINLLNFQRQFQGAARLVTVADEMLQELISLI